MFRQPEWNSSSEPSEWLLPLEAYNQLWAEIGTQSNLREAVITRRLSEAHKPMQLFNFVLFTFQLESDIHVYNN